MKVIVTAGDVQDRDGAKQLLENLAEEDQGIKRLKRIWTDGSYRGELLTWTEDLFGWQVEIVEKSKEQSGFQALPKRWIVERTLPGWFINVAEPEITNGCQHLCCNGSSHDPSISKTMAFRHSLRSSKQIQARFYPNDTPEKAQTERGTWQGE